ncbi:DNA-directed RNA polymerase subunit K [candidate division MSBL1 archaeon SCGC-AAA259D18]|uniref:DNA-directed RNA polymerase subunit Rpo6 n=1 Tax=candidate division MSBL1 archaeon SCGC-AAA259D18 TaxID=1698262 RepID=A0A133U9S2_9EURY|nr:DNA-directed RNA polymerase subunit K [candidate division MSBL1 archaeon SCGC-AAA259D18]
MNLTKREELLIYPKKFTRFEKARIIGARAIQIELGAPVLVNVPEDVSDPTDIAAIEFEHDAIPMTIVRRLPSGERIS